MSEITASDGRKAEPVVWEHSHQKFFKEYSKLRLTEDDKKNGWTERPLYAHPVTDPAKGVPGDVACPVGSCDVLIAGGACKPACVTALRSASPSPAVEGAGTQVTVREIECVQTWPPGEPADPIWRIEIDGYCADFEHEQAAQNFAGAINRRIAAQTRAQPVAGGEDVRALVAAAQPFADVADEYHDDDFDTHEVWVDAGPQALIRSSFELRKYRAVRTAIRALKGSDAGGSGEVPTVADMAAFGASHVACYLYPGSEQQKERSAFCDGSAHAMEVALAVPRHPTNAMGEVDRLLAALRAADAAELFHSNCGECGGEGDWTHCAPCSEKMGNAIDLRHAAIGEVECHGLDTPERVCFYEQDFYVLSNFSSFSIMWQGLRFDTSEHLYHWLKFATSPDGKSANRDIASLILNAPSAHEAFKLAERHRHERRPDWDEVKVDFMRRILCEKAGQHEYVSRKLLATGDRELVENSWRDDFWGWGPNRDGQNMLGKLWMEIRSALRTGAGR